MQSSNVISVLHQPQQSPSNVTANQYNQFDAKCHRSNSLSINSANKRKRKESIVLPTKFLLGGNINDPLNLASLANRGEQLTPQTSPLQNETKQVEIIIPANLNDPLNLNCGDGESESNFKRGNRKKRRKRTDSETTVDETEKETNTNVDRALHLNLSESCLSANKCEKIVSPVVPQNGPLGKHRKITPEKAKTEEKRFQRFHRSTSKSNKERKHKFRKQDEKFRYGNYNRYYGYRNQERNVDPRLAHFRRAWFENKEVLDIGCNVGFVTLMIAKHFNPTKIIGIDIDSKLIASARKNIRHYITKEVTSKAYNFPISMLLCHGPIIAQPEPSTSEHQQQQSSVSHFPHNIAFLECNYVLDNDEQLAEQKQEFDTIVCLSVTKWIHLNWGDQGLKRFFKRVYAQLRPGGILILEAQPLCSYKRKKFVSEETLKNFYAMKFKPEQFNEYLLSKEVGFNTCHLIDTPEHSSKGRITNEIFIQIENNEKNKATKFKSANSIPKSFIKKNVRLQGTVENVTNDGILQVNHKPIVSMPWHRSNANLIDVRLIGVTASVSGAYRLKFVALNHRVWFRPIVRRDNVLNCIVHTSKKSLWNTCLNVDVVQQGCARFDVFDESLKKNSYYVALHKALVKSERKAEKNRLGIWYYPSKWDIFRSKLDARFKKLSTK